MRSPLALASLLLLALAGSAHASGVGIRWGSCEGTANRNFACDKSTGSELLVGSFDPPPGVDQLTGIEVVLSITSASGTVPTWWQGYYTGACRRTSFAASFDVSDQFECDDPWAGAATGGWGNWVLDGTGVNISMVAAISQDQAQSVHSGTSYAAFKIVIKHDRSNGPGSCTGCDVPMCVKLEAIRLAQPGRPVPPVPGEGSGKTTAVYSVLTTGMSGMGGSAQVATWQNGTPNCAAGQAKASTWSELKSRFKSK